jgi:TPR repeat protein
VPQDKVQAAWLYWQAADHGVVSAQYSLCANYDKGEAVPQAKAQAAQLYRQAADEGLAGAQHNISHCYWIDLLPLRACRGVLIDDNYN